MPFTGNSPNPVALPVTPSFMQAASKMRHLSLPTVIRWRSRPLRASDRMPMKGCPFGTGDRRSG